MLIVNAQQGTILRNQIRCINSNGLALPAESSNSTSTSMPWRLESAAASFHSLPLHKVEPHSKPIDGTLYRAPPENLNYLVDAPSQSPHNSIKIQLSRISIRLVGFSNTSYLSTMRFSSKYSGNSKNFQIDGYPDADWDPILSVENLPLVLGVHDERPPNFLERHRHPNSSPNVRLNINDQRNDVVRPNN